MKRSVRSGIAIAGMAGGFWLLGQAVADAATPPPDGSTATGSTAAGAALSGSADAASGNSGTSAAQASGTQTGTGSAGSTQDVKAKNTTTNGATAGTVHAGGGTSAVGVAAGNGNTVVAKSGSGNVTATQDVTTVIWVDASATGAKASGSGNAAAGNNATYKAAATGTQNSQGGKGSGNSQDVTAKNYTHNDATGGNIHAGGGLSAGGVIAGNGNTEMATSGKHHKNNGDVTASQTISTKITAGSSATGAVVDTSGNAWAGNNATSSAEATGTQNSGTGKKGHREDCKENEGSEQKAMWGDRWCKDGEHQGRGNDQDVDAINDTDNNAEGGDINAGGGTSVVGVIAGNGNTLYCTSKTGNVTCSQNITTIINIISKATGATVTCSGNASAGNSGHIVCQETIAPVQKPGHKPGHKPVQKPVENKPATPVKTLVPVSHHHHTHALTSTQSSGELAFTGAETSLPLTLGLLALGAGGALTLAGRRRETTTV